MFTTKPPGRVPRAVLAALAVPPVFLAGFLGATGSSFGTTAGADEAAEAETPVQETLECLPGELTGTLHSDYLSPDLMPEIPATPEAALEAGVADLPAISADDFDRVLAEDGLVRFAVQDNSRRTATAQVVQWGDGWVASAIARCQVPGRLGEVAR